MSFGLRPNFTPLAFASACPALGALLDAAAFQLRGNAKHGKDKLGKVRGGVNDRLGNRAQARAGLLQVAGDNEQVGRVA